jgi:hypothetical protein
MDGTTTTLRITTFSTTTLSIMAISIRIKKRDNQHNDTSAAKLSFIMLSVTNKPTMLGVFIPSVVMLNVVVLSVMAPYGYCSNLAVSLSLIYILHSIECAVILPWTNTLAFCAKNYY